MRGGGYKAIGYDLCTLCRMTAADTRWQHSTWRSTWTGMMCATHCTCRAAHCMPSPRKSTLYFNFLRHDGIRVLGDVEFCWAASHAVPAHLVRRWQRGSQPQPLGPFAQGGGVPLLLYVGSADLVCHELGHEKLIDALRWPGRARFRGSAAPRGARC